jgi:hypothetical protein
MALSPPNYHEDVVILPEAEGDFQERIDAIVYNFLNNNKLRQKFEKAKVNWGRSGILGNATYEG